MNNSRTKRGRPSTRSVRGKSEHLDMPLEAAEKKAFCDAADLAGLDLSAWVRERLRGCARQELEGAGRPVAFVTGPEQLLQAEFVRPNAIRLVFTDRTFSLPIRRLEMPAKRFRWETVRAMTSGAGITVTGVKGESIPIDSSALRFLVDEQYADGVRAALANLRLSRDQLGELSKSSRPPRGLAAERPDDAILDSWK